MEVCTTCATGGGSGGGVVEPFTPQLVTVDGAGITAVQPDYVAADSDGPWGGASYGWMIDDGTMVTFALRVVTGSLFGDFDMGAGFLGVELPVPPVALAGPVAQTGWIAATTNGSSVPRQDCALICDPVYSDAAGLFGPSGLRDFAGSDPDAEVPPAFAIMPDYPIVTTDALLALFVAAGRYRKAAS